MKIYEIGTGYTPIPAQVAAATESVVEELTKAFIKENIDVEILDISSSDRVENSLPITEVKVPSIFTKSDVSLGIVHKMKRVVYSIALALKLKKILSGSNEKIVLHFHNQYNLFFFLKVVNKKLRSKAIIAYTNHNGYWSLPYETAKPTLESRYFQEIEGMKNADIIFALNEKMRQSIIENQNISPDKVVQINNGVNTDIYYPLKVKEVEKIKEKFNLKGKRVILQVGSVYENKGQGRSVELLAPALKKDNSLVFAFAGGIVSQEYYQEVLGIAQKNGVADSVSYLGAVSPGKEMNELYNMAQATVFVSKYEGFALVGIESLSAGVPVILCSDALCDFGDGSLMTNSNSFADCLNSLINDSDELVKQKTLARENVINNFTWSKIAQDYYNNFKK